MRTLAQEFALPEYQRTDGFRDPRDRIRDDTLPLAERFDLLSMSHPTSFCRRDKLALQAALEAIDRIDAATALLAEHNAALAETVRAQGGHVEALTATVRALSAELAAGGERADRLEAAQGELRLHLDDVRDVVDHRTARVGS